MSFLIWAEPGVEAEPLLLKEALDKKATLFVTNKKPLTLVSEASVWGYDLKGTKIIDLYSPIMKRNFKKVRALIKNEKGIRAFNDITPLVDEFGAGVTALLKNSICAFTSWPYDDKVLASLKRAFDKKVYLNSVLVKGELRKYFSFLDNGKWKHVPFAVQKGKGFVKIKPRVIIIGPGKSGKTTLLSQLSEKKLVIDELSGDFKIERGEMSVDGQEVELYSADGDSTKILDLLSNEATTVVVTINDDLNEVRSMIVRALSKGVNVTVNSDSAPEELMDLDVNFVRINHDLIKQII